MRKITFSVFAIGLVLSMSSCSKANEDRSDEVGNGTKPDSYVDAYNVTIARNVDDVPNVAMFCVDGMRFASTLSGTDGVSKPPQLLRLPEKDGLCAK